MFHRFLICCLLLLSAWSSFAQDPAPSSYSAYTGTDPKTVPPAPQLGPANYEFLDPTFGSRMLRVTDANTNNGASFIAAQAGFHRTWNANSTAFQLTNVDGSGYWMEFNPATFRVGDGSSHPVPHQLSFGANSDKWEWSALDPDIIYFLNGSQIAKYNKSTNVTTNLGGPSNGDPVRYRAVVIGLDNWVCAAAGTGIQDTFTKIYCLNPTAADPPSTALFIDVPNKTIQTINGVEDHSGDPNWPTATSGQTLGIHSISGGTGASWLSVTFHQQNWGGNGDSVFNVATKTWSLLKDNLNGHGGDQYWSGHHAVGNGKFTNGSGAPQSWGNDGRGYVLRDPDNLQNFTTFYELAPQNQLGVWCSAEHVSWFNSVRNPNAPALISRYGINCPFLWDGEIVAAATDGSNTVWRFAHNHNTYNTDPNHCFEGQVFTQISNDGKWALLSSGWDGQLGAGPGFTCSTRIDMFIVALVPSGLPTLSVNPPPLNGSVTSNDNPQTINCGSTCSHEYASQTQVTLTANPNAGFVFSSWGGACSGTATTCTLTMDVSKTVSATFSPVNPTLTISPTPTNGSVTSNDNPQTINCGSTCSHAYAPQTQITLTANPNAGFVFSSWGGACSGTATTCTLTMDVSKTVSATFTPNGNPPIATDDFNRANGPLGSNWTNQVPGGFTTSGVIFSNAVGPDDSSTTRRAAHYIGTTFSADQYSQVSISVLPQWSAGAAVRMQGGGVEGYYAAGFDNNDFSPSDTRCRIWKYIIVGGIHQASSLADDLNCHIAAGDTLKLEVQGNILRFYQNGVLKLTTPPDNTYTSGSPGFEFTHNAVNTTILDNWAGGNLSAAPPTTSDDFNRANGPLGSNWTNQVPGGFTTSGVIFSNAVGPDDSSTTRRAAHYIGTTFSADQYSQVSISVLPQWSAGAAVRMQGGGVEGYYAAGFDNNDFSPSDTRCRIWKYIIVGGIHQASSLADDLNCHIAAGDTLKLEVQGNILRFYQNGVLKLTTPPDNTYTSGSPGFEFTHNAVNTTILDNWAGGNVSP